MIFLLITSPYYINEPDPREYYQIENPWFTIDINISSNTTDDFKVKLPVPIKGYGVQDIIEEGIPIDEIYLLDVVTGSGNYSINNDTAYMESANYTDFVKNYIEINGTGSIHLRYHIENQTFEEFSELSTTFAYYSDSNLSVSYNINFGIRNLWGSFIISDYYSESGWQEMYHEFDQYGVNIGD